MRQQIDLAPKNAYSLVLRTPVLARAPALPRVMQRLAALAGVAGLLTAPIGARRSRGRIGEAPAGVLLEDEVWPAPAALRLALQWTDLDVPVLALLDEDEPRQLAALVLEFGEESPPAAFVVAAGSADATTVRERVAAVRAVTPLPLLIGLDVDSAALDQAQAAAGAGAEALVLSAGPPGALMSEGALMSGRLEGPAAEPAVLAVVAALREALPALPLVAPAGSLQGANDLLAAGTQALVLRAALWRDPSIAARIAEIGNGAAMDEPAI